MKVSIIVIRVRGWIIVVIATRRKPRIVSIIRTTILVHLSGRTITQCIICILTHFCEPVSQILWWSYGYEPPNVWNITSKHFTKRFVYWLLRTSLVLESIDVRCVLWDRFVLIPTHAHRKNTKYNSFHKVQNAKEYFQHFHAFAPWFQSVSVCLFVLCRELTFEWWNL